MADDYEAIHNWFGLSYANYLVLPRAVLQSMPDEWQQRFVEFLEEMRAAFGHLDWKPTNVQVLARQPQRFTPWEECEECDGTGFCNIETGKPATELELGQPNVIRRCSHCDEGKVEGEERFETPEEVGIVTDPIPHYNRGHTRLKAAS